MAKRKREDEISSADTKSPISGKNIIDFISSFENPSHVLAMTNVVNFCLWYSKKDQRSRSVPVLFVSLII